MARAADELPPTQRVMRIAEIFSLFCNPDKETVLTPWRVVNMHLSDMLGGFCFYDEIFNHPDGLLEAPRLIDRGDASEAVLLNPDAKILEMNSKSGLYPRYMTYSIYAMKLTGREDSIPREDTQRLWRETVEQNIYILCKTKMARLITMRTLVGYQDWPVNAIYLTRLMERMQDMKRLSNKLRNPATWGKGGEKMKFDAVVGNPPYQEMDMGNRNSATPGYQYFVQQAKAIEPRYISMITLSRWFAGGKGLDDFRKEMLTDRRLRKLKDYVDSTDCFVGVDIAGGISYFLWDNSHSGECEFTSVRGDYNTTLFRNLSEYDILIRNNGSIRLIKELSECADPKMDEYVGVQDTFGIRTFVEGQESKANMSDLKMARSIKGNQLIFVYIPIDTVRWNTEIIDQYKVVIGRSVPRNGEVGVDPTVGYRAITTVHVFGPGTVFTDTYLLLSSFKTEIQAKNFAEYMTLRFPRFLLHETYSFMSISKENFRFVPYLDYSKGWTDEELFARYHCTPEEIHMINSMMRPLEYIIHE